MHFFMLIKMLVRNNFGICWVQKECWVQNILRLKIIGIQKIWVQTNVTRTNKNSGPKKSWNQKTLGPKKFSVHKISGQKKSLGQLSPGEMLHAQMSL